MGPGLACPSEQLLLAFWLRQADRLPSGWGSVWSVRPRSVGSAPPRDLLALWFLTRQC